MPSKIITATRWIK